jgi:HSP20 family protein
MAHQQERQGQERQGQEREGQSERGLATRQYQDPFSLLDTMFERMQRDFFGTSLFNALLPARGGNGETDVPRVPRVQMRDTGDAIEVMAELPGIEPKDVQIECEDDMLTIRGETELDEETDGGRVQRHISFFRRLSLPENMDTEQAQASYQNGMLSIRFPKRSQRENVRQIPINTQSSSIQSSEPKQQKDRAA